MTDADEEVVNWERSGGHLSTERDKSEGHEKNQLKGGGHSDVVNAKISRSRPRPRPQPSKPRPGHSRPRLRPILAYGHRKNKIRSTSDSLTG